MTIQMASQQLGKSESTIRRWIRTGKLTASMVDGAYDILEDAINCLVNGYPNDKAVDSQPEGVDQSLIIQLRSENEYLKERIQELEEAHETEKRGWWKRIFKSNGGG